MPSFVDVLSVRVSGFHPKSPFQILGTDPMRYRSKPVLHPSEPSRKCESALEDGEKDAKRHTHTYTSVNARRKRPIKPAEAGLLQRALHLFQCVERIQHSNNGGFSCIFNAIYERVRHGARCRNTLNRVG
mmetsp:Transcript_2166/g.14254  ORF Transcript_2166/g.14254 Transcript_2166/m.14254 type:complete len:130 (+) Transcript_2166:3051-3440(+)